MRNVTLSPPGIKLGLKKKAVLGLIMQIFDFDTVEPRNNEVHGTMKITLLYQVSHIRVKKQ